MFCIIAFIVLSILGIFSASNRVLAREALDCVFRRVTLRPCNTGFDEKMKARILGSVITRSETAAVFLNRNFEILAWVFFLLLMSSGIYSIRGIFLFYTTGSCNGLNSSSFCVFDPTGKNNDISTGTGCSVKPKSETGISLNGVDLAGVPVVNSTGQNKIVMIGCYHCDYTRKTYPMIRDLANRYHASFTFFNYPVKEKNDYFTRLSYCVNKQDPAKYWAFNDLMFTGDKSQLDTDTYIDKILAQAGLDVNQVKYCTSDMQTSTVVQNQMTEMQKTSFYGTPTVFINGKALVGPKPYRVYAIQLKGLLYWLY